LLQNSLVKHSCWEELFVVKLDWREVIFKKSGPSPRGPYVWSIPSDLSAEVTPKCGCVFKRILPKRALSSGSICPDI